MTDTTTTRAASKRLRKMAREPQGDTSKEQIEAPAATTTEKPKSKAAMVLELLKRPEGATLDDLVSATGWLPHTTRAALTGLRKKGHVLTSEKVGEVRRYRVHAGAGAGE